MKKIFKSLICCLLCSCFFATNINANTSSIDESSVETIYVEKNISDEDLKELVQSKFDEGVADIINVKFVDNLIASPASVFPQGRVENYEHFYFMEITNILEITVSAYQSSTGAISSFSSDVGVSGKVIFVSKKHHSTTSRSAYAGVMVKLSGGTFTEYYRYKAPLFGDIKLNDTVDCG